MHNIVQNELVSSMNGHLLTGMEGVDEKLLLFLASGVEGFQSDFTSSRHPDRLTEVTDLSSSTQSSSEP